MVYVIVTVTTKKISAEYTPKETRIPSLQKKILKNSKEGSKRVKEGQTKVPDIQKTTQWQ